MLIEQGVFLYRQRYVTEGRGKIENRLYPAIPVVLAKLKEQGKRLYIATAKMKSAADEIIKHFSLWDFFDGVYGPTPEGALADKADLVAHILDREKIAPQSAVMIGDREHDIIAANKNNIQSIGACWGYGSKEELQKAGATMLAERPEDLLKYLCVSHAVPNR